MYLKNLSGVRRINQGDKAKDPANNDLKGEANNGSISSVYKALMAKPVMTKYVCRAKGNDLIEPRSRALLCTPTKPAGSREQGQLPLFEANRTHMSRSATC